MIEIIIDNKVVCVPEGSMVIDAARRANKYIPHFCYHRKLTIAANCRMCLVEVEKNPKVVPACATPVATGMIVQTHSTKVIKAQQAVIEFLLINHPLDCPICDQGGECQLQDLVIGYGNYKSRYLEKKRVVFHKNVGPLLSLEEMSRCIHCTRCVRFSQEISGITELGMLGRGENSEISNFIGQNINSELSGNMIDLCPVGAITSKPFRYKARNWELSSYQSISPHDSFGTNLIIQVKNNTVVRVLPLENNEINECWISDKDRFSYEALNSEHRLTQPLMYNNKKWCPVNWKIALQYIVDKIQKIRVKYGNDAIAILASPHSTIEELFLVKSIANNLKINNIDHRIRQVDLALITQGTPWLGTNISSLDKMDRIFIIGSNLNSDQPLLAVRIRQAVRNGAKIYLMNATSSTDKNLASNTLVAPPSSWLDIIVVIFNTIMTIVNKKTFSKQPLKINSISTEQKTFAEKIALSITTGKNIIILLGNSTICHPDLTIIYYFITLITKQVNSAKLGFLPEAANSVGAYLLGVLPGIDGLNASEMFNQQCKAYILFGTEPEFDTSNPIKANYALKNAELVVSLNSFKHGLDYNHVLLPISPFTETAGTFINLEGRIQHFNAVTKPLEETRPAWKVLCLLGNMLNLSNFSYRKIDEITELALSNLIINKQLNNSPSFTSIFHRKRYLNITPNKFERFADIPIYNNDSIVRHASSLQKTQVAKKALIIGLPSVLFYKLGLKYGDSVKVIQNNLELILLAQHEPELNANVIRFSASTLYSACFGSLYGELKVERI